MKTTATISLAAALVLIGARAHAQNYDSVTVVPGYFTMVRGASFRNGDLVALEPTGLFFVAPIRQPFALLARPILGLGGSGLGIGLAWNPLPECPSEGPSEKLCWRGDDFFTGPFVSLEGHV